MDALQLLAFVLPAYVANASPVVFGGGTPVDFGRVLGGKRVFGEGKTWRGLLAGVVFGTFTGFALALLPAFFLPSLAFRQRMIVALLLSVGTMAGDLAGSFVKRRLGIAAGSRHEFFDQLLFLGFALAAASVYIVPSLEEIGLLVVATYVLHKAANWLAHVVRLKRVPW